MTMKVTEKNKITLSPSAMTTFIEAHADWCEDAIEAIMYQDDTEDLIPRTEKLYETAKAVSELFRHYWNVQHDTFTDAESQRIIRTLLMDKIGLTLALNELTKRLAGEDECELTEAERAELADANPSIDISKLEEL